jgi:hypothetical protein
MIMTKFITALLIATVVVGAATGASARPARSITWIDQSQPYGGFDPNSPEGNRAFWDYQGRHGR